MNFDFLKNLKGWESIYKNCNDAERLAMSMPMQSMFTARKSAETLAKFVYMTAHQENAREMNFVDILSDPVVISYIHNKNVLDAFHRIRKSGNRAVHEDEPETSDNAMKVLKGLHYVTGEVACVLGLLKDYPRFNPAVPAYSSAESDEKITAYDMAVEMFSAYLNYSKQKLAKSKQDRHSIKEAIRDSIESNGCIHEYFEIAHRAEQSELVEYVSDYLLNLCWLKAEQSKNDSQDNPDKFEFTASINIEGKIIRSTDLQAFIKTILEQIPKAKLFSVDIMCNGKTGGLYCDKEAKNFDYESYFNNNIQDNYGMFDKLESYKRRDNFNYYSLMYFYDSGNVNARAIVNGKTRYVADLLSANIDKIGDVDIFCDGLSIYADDLSRYPETFERIKTYVRENVYEDQIHFCEDAWDADNDEYIENCVMPFVQIKADTIDEYERFLVELNKIVEANNTGLQLFVDEPNLEESMNNDSSNIMYNIEQFVLAVVMKTENGLHVIGGRLNELK